MTITTSAAGTRIDCDQCTRHVGSRFLHVAELRKLTDYVNIDDRDYCPACAARTMSARSASAWPGAQRS